MFYLRYIAAELSRRRGRTVLTALGLGVGVGLVVAVTALSAGLDEAQSEVLEPLTGVGTDMSVSRPIVVEEGQGEEGTDFAAGPGAPLSRAEQRQLEKENGRLELDFSEYGDPGDRFTTRQFMATDLSFPEREAVRVARIDGVSGVGEALTLNQIKVSGTVPSESSQEDGLGPPTGDAPGAAPGGDQTGFDQSSVTGLDAANPDLAPVTEEELVDGRYIDAKAGDEAMVSQSYANSNSVEAGDEIKVGSRAFTVVGIVKAPLGGETSDFYVPLAALQRLSDREGRINVLEVRADSSDRVATVAEEIEATFPGSDVTTARDLAERVSGSLVDAKNLSSKLGAALAVVALLAAFGIASLLTLASVNKRIRELGTLKALGWHQWLVVRQVSGEAAAQGLLGGVVGAAIGIAAAALIDAVGISLEASVGGGASAGFGPPGGPFGQGAIEAGTSTVVLGAPVDAGILAMAIGLAVLGGLIAGSVGGLRAARLRPAEALRSVE